MKKRLLAILLIMAMLFSLTACKSADDEESAVSGNVTTSDKNDSTPSTDTDKNTDSNTESGDSQNQTPDTDDQTDNNDGNNGSEPDDKEDSVPPLSTTGDYTVTFDFGYDGKQETEKTEGKVTEIKPEREGYDFDGWYSGNKKWNFASDTVSADTKLTAKWNVITYTITYEANGATLPSGNPTTYTVETEDIDLNPATKPFGVFIGWSYVSEKGTITINTIAKGTTGDLVLSPSWNENEIMLGTYEQDGDTANGKEPILWIKIKEENGKALYTSKYILDGRAYHSPKANVNWYTSNMRKWLNDSFYKTAFSSQDKEAVLLSDIHTDSNPTTKVGTPCDTKDYVFLFSLEEADKFLTYAQKKVKVTNYAKSQGCLASDSGAGDWWLRTPGHYENYAALVQQNGGSRDGGYGVDLPTVGVRPAIWVDTTKLG